MSDSAALFERLLGASLEALVVNERGATAAVDAGARVLVGVVAVSDAFSHRNVGQSTADAIVELGRIASVAHDRGVAVTVDLATAFGCAYTGRVAVDDVVRVSEAVADLGVEEITLADTIGAAAPNDITEVVATVTKAVGGGVAVGLHLHDTRGLALANACAGLDAGVRRFDASVGGLGGCPFSPGATGNVCTEDLVHLLHALGVETGIDLDALVAVSATLEEDLGFTLPSHLLRAGPRFRL
jgi:hydroxymethylglutaryl-CoA lyase